MKALYRRWRPVKLDDVVGQEQVTTALLSALKTNRISHAYLFTGPRGTGKTSVARIFAHAVNDFSYQLEDDYVDIIEIDGASNRGVDNIREIREKAAIKPTAGKYKVYIIDEVHMLTKEAFNALLKTLEEPPAHVIFIMATTDAYKVPVTITSRAQVFTFKLAEKDVIFEHLKKICAVEKIKIDDDALAVVVKRGGGSFRDTLSLLDQISTLDDEKITKALVEKAMGLPEDETIQALLDNFVNGNVVKITTLLKDLYSAGVKSEVIAEELIAKIIGNPIPRLLALLDKLPDVKAPFPEAKLLVALTMNVAAPDTPTAPTDHNSGSGKDVVAPNIPVVPIDHNFDWGNFLKRLEAINTVLYTRTKDARWKMEGEKLVIEPSNSFFKTILTKPANLKVLRETAGREVVIFGDKNVENDDVGAKISGIMGGEVEKYGGGSPF